MLNRITVISVLLLTLTQGNAIPAQDDAYSFDRQTFPPVLVGQLYGDCLVTIEGTGLAYAGFSTVDPYQVIISEAVGTGFICRSDGYILTTREVVSDSKDLTVKHLGTEYEATVDSVDDYFGLAMLKIDATDLPAVNWGNSDLVERGCPVVVMGSPMGLDKTLTYGFVTNIRDFRVPGPRGFDGMLIQDGFVVDAAIHSGVEAGPVFNADVEMIGVVAMRAGGGIQNIGYVIPSNHIRGIVDQMIDNQRICHPWLGIFPYERFSRTLAVYMGIPIDEIDPETDEKYDVVGVLVDAVAEMSPAIAAGIKRGDLILRADDILLRTIGDLEEIVQNKGCGDSISLIILRDGDLHLKILEIADKQEDYGNIYVAGGRVSI